MNGAILFYLFAIITVVFGVIIIPVLKSKWIKRKIEQLIGGVFASVYIILGTLFPFYTNTNDVNQEILLIGLVLFCYAMAILSGISIFKPVPKAKIK